MAFNNLDLQSAAEEIEKNLPSREYTLGKGLLQPFNDSNSGSRKIMQGIQKEQNIQLCEPEVPIVMTGYENQFGELSSSFVVANSNYVLVDKIYKTPKKYSVLLHDIDSNYLHFISRTEYEYQTELYGFNLDTHILDEAKPGTMFEKGSPLITSASYDRYYNKQDGVNLTTVYISSALNIEDPIILSESAAKKFRAPIFNSIEIIINENDVPLNLYGNDEFYKIFPDIGEEVKNGIFCGIRRERKDDETLYSQSKEHLKQLMISDTTYISEGEVIDIEVCCNNPDKLNDMYYQQLKVYYEKNMEYCIAFYNAVDSFMSAHPKAKMTYELQKEYTRCKETVSSVQYIKDKVFNNILMRVVTRANKPLSRGDKITDRYGGKGVVSTILPDDKMPHYVRNGEYKPVDAIYNSCTVINRLNPGQSFETEITYIGAKLLERISSIWFDAVAKDLEDGSHYNTGLLLEGFENMIYSYIHILNPEEADDWIDIVRRENTVEERMFYLESLLELGNIPVVIRPMKDRMDVDKLRELYEAFPFVTEDYLFIKQLDSAGNPRMVRSRRPIVIGTKYIYKLKQLAKEKFSAVSLASTNIRGENTKTKANKMHISAISKTPVRLGNMEATELMQLPESQYVIEAFMLLSTSPTGRRLMSQLLTGDPFDRNIVLDENARSRNVEVANAYLKCMGLRLVFSKKEKRKKSGILVKAVDVTPPTFKELHPNGRAVFTTPFCITPNGYRAALKKLTDIYYKGKKPTDTPEDRDLLYNKMYELCKDAESDEDLLSRVTDDISFVRLEPAVFFDIIDEYKE